ncbi:NPCBM/NEW2 domain-containing protein [Micromonospora sp. NPDC047074]|uniref:NPCBM/NEW2 domain-containing protein n=1 Tax=Micromonospora sp. NPDC047074 TaxID=3154339 RepID=UPI0033FB240C
MANPRRRRSSHPAIIGAVIAAVATVVAAAIPVVWELTRDRGGSGAAAPVQGTPSAAQPQSTAPATSTGARPAPTLAAPAASPSRPAQPDVLPLVDMAEMDDFEGWEQEPLIVAGKLRDPVLTTSPCWLNDHFTVTFVVSRQFRLLEAAVGIADESSAGALRFTVLADSKEVFTTSVGLGRTRPVKVDISDATQVSLRVSTTNLNQCHRDSIGVWIGPQLRR